MSDPWWYVTGFLVGYFMCLVQCHAKTLVWLACDPWCAKKG
jgi:hypothetical protein